jgi:hypothetical protein
MSALASQPDILIKGAFNGWRWNPFTEKLHKSELTGDWWCCKLYIPKQAYRLDFVFFNGDTVYENNNYNDFVLQIKSDIDEHSFEDFLLEEKQRELERLAAEEAERERQAEEERRKEEERAKVEADREQAKAEVEMTRNRLQNVLGSASRYADNLWYIEPNTYKGGDRVRLYYNRSSRPLKHTNEIWLHGGYNNWIDGPSIAERLVKFEETDGDWWYATGMLIHTFHLLGVRIHIVITLPFYYGIDIKEAILTSKTNQKVSEFDASFMSGFRRCWVAGVLMMGILIDGNWLCSVAMWD